MDLALANQFYKVKELKYKQIWHNYRKIFQILYNLHDPDLLFKNNDELRTLISTNIELEKDLDLKG